MLHARNFFTLIIGYFTLAFMLCIENVEAQHIDTLPAIKVEGVKYNNVNSATLPVQHLNAEALSALNSLTVADAIKYFAGVLVKDYGGIGGLKTVSVRSLGANHTTVLYDGVAMADAQGGQIDLGKLSLDNIESISLYNPQPDQLLLPARSFASAAVLVLNSKQPVFNPTKKLNTRVGFKGGSFGLINPAVSIRFQPSKQYSTSLSAEYQSADGRYSYKSYESNGSKQKRTNSDIRSGRLEYDANYQFSDSNAIRFKAYYYSSERGLPGAIVFFNSVSGERLKDQNFFSQATWKLKPGTKSQLLFTGKYNGAYNFYLDPNYQNSQGKIESKFHQQELYGSGALSIEFNKKFSLGYASDISTTTLKRKDQFNQGFAAPVRTLWLNNAMLLVNAKQLKLQANLLYTRLQDKVALGSTGRKIDALTPAVSAGYEPSVHSKIKLRAFYKKIFRAPTFNDLYYTFVGNVNLRPEYAQLYNAGITWKHNSNRIINAAFITVDAYYNKVKDKIIAVPRQNLFQWTMLNIGFAEIKGIDAAVQSYFKPIWHVNFTARLSYTYQQALDKANPQSSTYNKQLPYTPVHSGSIHLGAGYKAFSFGYNVLLSSERYGTGEQLPSNKVNEWMSHDVVASYDLKQKNQTHYRVSLELNNIFNQSYEIIHFYPMPGVNFRAALVADF